MIHHSLEEMDAENPFLALYKRLKVMRDIGMGWTQIAATFEHARITRAHIYRIVIDCWEPDDPELRIILGLPAYKPAPVCPIHGVVHDYDCQTQVVKPLRKPRARAPRIAIRKDDMGKAATTIMNNLNRDEVTELVSQLRFRLKELTNYREEE